MKRVVGVLLVSMMTEVAAGAILVTQNPVSSGGVMRWSQLWQDPGPDGNDLDSDAVCWADFTLTQPQSINHLEWWGNGASELGFQIEFWKQDPSTIAYQPLGVFYYGGVHTTQLEPPGFIRAVPATSSGPGSLTHYSLDLDTPVNLAANDSANPRWFVGIVGLTNQAFVTWNWAQSLGVSTHTYQFLRADGRTYRALGDARALVIGAIGEPGDFDGSGNVDGRDFLTWQRNPSMGSLFNWQASYGGNVSPISQLGSIPEPCGLALASIAALFITNRRDARMPS